MEAGDRETRMRNIRLGRGDKGERRKRSVKRTRPRETERRTVPIREGSRNGAALSKGGMGDARGKDPPTQESRPLFGFKQGKGCKTRRGLGGRGRESRRARTGSLEMANAYGRSPEVRECKFYDQSGGLIRRRCALPRLRREGERDVRSRKTLGLAKHQ